VTSLLITKLSLSLYQYQFIFMRDSLELAQLGEGLAW